MRRSLAGEQAAFAALVARYRPRIADLAYRALGGNADDAQDVSQETFLYAFQRLGDLREPSRFGPWLRSITLSLAADHRRRKATRCPPGASLPWHHAEAVLAAERDLAETLALRDALRGLSEAQRAAFTLFHVSSLSQRYAL